MYGAMIEFEAHSEDIFMHVIKHNDPWKVKEECCVFRASIIWKLLDSCVQVSSVQALISFCSNSGIHELLFHLRQMHHFVLLLALCLF